MISVHKCIFIWWKNTIFCSDVMRTEGIFEVMLIFFLLRIVARKQNIYLCQYFCKWNRVEMNYAFRCIEILLKPCANITLQSQLLLRIFAYLFVYFICCLWLGLNFWQMLILLIFVQTSMIPMVVSYEVIGDEVDDTNELSLPPLPSKEPKRKKRSIFIVDSLHLLCLIASYNIYFAKYCNGCKEVSQRIPSLMWKEVFKEYKYYYSYSHFVEETLKNCLKILIKYQIRTHW